MTPPTIRELWTTYLANVVPAAASAAQREETKRAFYAGAQAMFLAVMGATMPEDERVCEAHLTALERELEDYLHGFKQREGIL